MMVRLNNMLRARVRGESADSGIAMIMVMGTIMVLTALLTAAIGYAMQVQPQARKDQDWNAALAAAQAGVDDYIAKLNGSDSYWMNIDCTNAALAGPVAAGSCGYTAATPAGWRDIQLGNPTAGKFHYDVDPSIIYSQGAVRLSSTGKVGKTSRTVQVNVSRGGPTSFLYYTDFEDADPANTLAYGSAGASTDACGKSGPTLADYFYDNSSRGCSEINFVTGDTLDGAVHFNDTPLINGSTKFLKGYETADPDCKLTPYDVNNCMRGSGTPNTNGVNAKWAPTLDLVDNSAAFATFPGCVYTGDTRIRFKNNGTMDVWNTGSSSGTTVVGPGSPAGTDCGVVANYKPTSASNPTPSGKQTVNVPNDMVIYVKNGSTATSCAPGQIVNGSASGSDVNDEIPLSAVSSATGLRSVSDISYFDPDDVDTIQNRLFTRGTSGGTAWNPGPLTVATAPLPNPDPNSDDHPQTFDCGSGNVYIEGTVKGRVTIAAQNNVIVTDDLLLDGVTPPASASGSSMVGLVSGNSVVDYHPVHRSSSTSTPVPTKVAGSGSCSGSSNSVGATPPIGGSSLSITCQWKSTENFNSSWSDLTFNGQTSSGGNRFVYASLQTLQHSFWVQNYNRGSAMGTLSVRGSMAQRWRGIVGTGNGTTGFLKDYSYDTRLKFSGPPYFPQWTNSVWGAQTTGEIKPAY
jgi:hypothetical protein